MGLREVAGEMARNTSGLWRGVADALDPDGHSPRGRRAATEVVSPPITREEPTIDLDADPPIVTGPVASATGEPTTMVVPLDTWTRILEQVGNVHEAGQQLADARERAARAETENRFLKEQLADFKTQRRPGRRPSAPAASTTDAPVAGRAAATGPETASPAYGGWRAAGSVPDRPAPWAPRPAM